MNFTKNWKNLSTKIISLMLVAALLLATFAGCAKPATPDVTVPTDPTTATNQTNSTDSTDATDATDSTDPTDPTDPADSTDPGEPTDPTEEATDAPTEEPTDAPTEAPTQAPTQTPTQAPTAAPTEPATEPPTEPPTEPAPINSLNGADLADFAIVYSANDLDYSQRAAQYIQEQILARTGLNLPLIKDTDATTAKYEIVVGQTSRSISSRLTPPSGVVQFAILAEDTQIALEGEYFVIAAAAYYFIETYVPKADFEAQIPKQVSVHDPIVKEAKNFIIMIGDGMGETTTLLYNHPKLKNAEYSDGENSFYGYYLPAQGYARTKSADSSVTDSAASGTALATGYKTNNGYVGQDKNHQPVQSLTELAGSLGMATAVMSTEKQTGATPSAFSAHADDRDLSGQIVVSQKALQAEYGTIINCDYDTYTKSGVANLEKEIRNTLNKLAQNENGFFMMYEEAYIDKHNHNHDMENAFLALNRFNQAIGTVMEFAFYNPETFVIITADHETGGLEINKYGGFSYTQPSHTGVDVTVSAYGDGSALFDGKTVENVQIPQTIATFMGVYNFGDQTTYKPLTK